jgi:hypothetical protein
MDPAWPHEFLPDHLWVVDPALQGNAGGLGDLEENRLARLALDHGGPFLHVPGREDIADPKAHQVAAAQFAVDGHVEQRKVTRVACHFKADPDGPDVPWKERTLLADDAALVPWGA